jgi:hypothetical protein
MTELEMILHSKKLGYDTLLPLMKDYIKPGNFDRTVNIFIDFWDILKPIYNPKTIETLNTINAHEKSMIASEIINIIGHYRHFFFSRMKLYTNFVFYFSNKNSEFRNGVHSGYRETFYDKRLNIEHHQFGVINKIIRGNINLIRAFCEYVPHAYFINSGNIDYSLIPSIFLEGKINYHDVDPKNETIIVSNEKIHYQDLLLGDNVMQLELRGKEKSRIITAQDIIPQLLSKSKKSAEDFTILPDLYSISLPLTGYKNFDVEGVKGMGAVKSLNFIQKQLDDNVLSNTGYSNLDSLKMIEDKFKDDNYSILERNMLLLNNKMYEYKNKDLIGIEMQIVEKIDGKSVKLVNEKYFSKHPILINFVFEGEFYG